jgi:hypothetical protein
MKTLRTILYVIVCGCAVLLEAVLSALEAKKDKK